MPIECDPFSIFRSLCIHYIPESLSLVWFWFSLGSAECWITGVGAPCHESAVCVIFIPDYFTFNLWSAARFLAAEVIRKLRWIVR